MSFLRLSIFVILAVILFLNFHMILSSASNPNQGSPSHHHQPAKEKRCLDRCDLHRKNWQEGPYQLDCSLVSDTKKCEKDCLSHTSAAGNSKGAHSPTLLSCPDAPKLSHKCLKRCDASRPMGNYSKYLLNCEKQFVNDEHQRLSCINSCIFCPDWICNQTKNPNLFYCPSAHLKGECKERCDSKRKSEDKAYLLSCAKIYENPEDQEDCTKSCGQCPPYVCVKNQSKVVYHCPSGPAAETASETTWLVLSLVLGIPAFILLIVIIWLCFYCSRHGGVLTRHNVVLHYGLQEQIPQDPYNLSMVTVLQSNTSGVAADSENQPDWAPDDDDKDTNNESTSQQQNNEKKK